MRDPIPISTDLPDGAEEGFTASAYGHHLYPRVCGLLLLYLLHHSMA